MKPITLLFALLLAGCGQDPVKRVETNNAAIKVDTLFTHDGCTVYRFEDWETVYYVKCETGETRTEWTTERIVSAGKGGTTVVKDHHQVPGWSADHD